MPEESGPDSDISTAEVPEVAPPVLSPGVPPGPPPAPAALPPPPTAERDGRRRWIIGLAGGTVALLAAVIVIAVAFASRGHHSGTSASDQSHRSSATATTANPSSSSSSSSTSTSAAAPTASRATIAALEGALKNASHGRSMLVKFSDHLTSCKLDGSDAELLQRVIANRRQVAAEARRIAARTHDGSTLPRDLAALMDQSAAADGAYLPWVQRSPHGAGAACQVPASVTAANAAVVDTKQAFVARFNAAAAAYNLDAGWTANDF